MPLILWSFSKVYIFRIGQFLCRIYNLQGAKTHMKTNIDSVNQNQKQEATIVYEIIDYTLNKEYALKMKAEGFLVNEV